MQTTKGAGAKFEENMRMAFRKSREDVTLAQAQTVLGFTDSDAAILGD